MVPRRPSSNRSFGRLRTEQAGIVDGGVIGDQHAGQGGQLQQAVPLRGVAGEAGDLQGQHDPDLPQLDGRHQPGEPVPLVRGGAAGRALALVVVNDRDLLGRPAQQPGTVDQPMIVRQIVELHGGRISVESTYGAGSMFHVAIPLIDAEAEPRSSS